MTVTYTAEVATSSYGTFIKLLFRWRGSIYKLVWADLLVYLALFYAIDLMHRFLVTGEALRVLEGIFESFNLYYTMIPLSFVLGFFVSLVMTRWWNQYTTIPWPDSIALFVSAHIQGTDDRARVMRRTVMRYVCLCQTMVFTMISPRVKRRFSTYNHLIEAGLLQESEKVQFERLDEPFPNYPKHWMPIVWAAAIVMRARKEGKIRDDYALKSIIDELNKFRGECGFLLYYDWINLPLVYVQVVTLAVYAFFLCAVIGQQLHAVNKGVNIYFPIFTILQFFFYMGWLRVVEVLMNPFGDDDEDFELNWMIDRNLQISYLMVDEMHNDHPELVRDAYWDEVVPSEMNDADEHHYEPPEASTAHIDTSKHRLAQLDSRNTSVASNRSTQRAGGFLSQRRDSNDSIYSTKSENLPVQRATWLSGSPRISTSLSRSLDAESLQEDLNKVVPMNDEDPVIVDDPNALTFEELVEQRRREVRLRNRSHIIQARDVDHMLNVRDSRTTSDDVAPDEEEQVTGSLCKPS